MAMGSINSQALFVAMVTKIKLKWDAQYDSNKEQITTLNMIQNQTKIVTQLNQLYNNYNNNIDYCIPTAYFEVTV